MAITSYTKDTDAISYVEDGITKKISVSGSDVVVSLAIEDMDRIIYMHRRQADDYVIIGYFDTNGDKQEIEFDPSATTPDNTFLPLAGGTMTGDIVLGANKIKTTTFLLKEYSAALGMAIRNLADDTWAMMTVGHLNNYGDYIASGNLSIRAQNLDTKYLMGKARDTGTGLVEIWRMVGAATAYFQATRGLVLLPMTDPANIVEGWLFYDSADDKVSIRDATAVRKLLTETLAGTTYLALAGGTMAGAIAMGGNTITAHAQAITDNALVTVDHASVVDNDYAKFTANGLEGRSYSEAAGDIGAARTATLIVAATDATAIEKASATYTCDGDTDETQLQAAYDALTAGQSLCLVGRTFTLTTAGLTFDTDLTSVFSTGQALLTTTVDIDGITISARVNVSNIRVQKTGAASTKAGYKLVDGAKNCRIVSPQSLTFKYGIEFNSSASGIGYCEIYNLYTYHSGTAEIYMTISGSGWINDNTFFGGNLHASAGNCIFIEHHNTGNKFYGLSCEGAPQYSFAIVDHGRNFYYGTYLELNCWGFYIHHDESNARTPARIIGTYWGCNPPLVVCADGYVMVDDLDGFRGLLRDQDMNATTVDADTAAGQKVLNVTATTGFAKKDDIAIDEGGAREEYCHVVSIQADVSLTLEDNLRYAHTAVQADAVVTKGAKTGMDVQYGWSGLNLWVRGVKVVELTNAGVMNVLGAVNASTAPAQ